MKKEILERIAEIEEGRHKRWEQHEVEHAEILRRLKLVEDHVKNEDEEDLIWEARFGPARQAIKFTVKNWKTVVLIVLSVAAILDQFRDTITLIIQGH